MAGKILDNISMNGNFRVKDTSDGNRNNGSVRYDCQEQQTESEM